MSDADKLAKLLAFVRDLAKDAGEDPYCGDDWQGADDYAAGNVDDAYETGRDHADASTGNAALAVLQEIGEPA